MIGDRVDNDIAPAKSVGMHTIWLPLTVDAKNYQPKDEMEKIYLESVKRASISLMPPRSESETPDEIARSFEEILQKVEPTRRFGHGKIDVVRFKGELHFTKGEIFDDKKAT